jgi:hypothetical protein
MSTLRVNTVANSGGTPVLVNGYPTQPGQIIECLTSPCDGSSVIGISGTYTWPNVSATQDITATSVDITGSSISYVPPVGASKVVYKFNFSQAWRDTQHSIQHYRFFIDSNEVVFARNNRSADYLEVRTAFEWTINIGGSTNNNSGRQASWTSPKTLKMQSRRYSTSSNGGVIHGTYYWDGTGLSNQFSMPTLTIEAIA